MADGSSLPDLHARLAGGGSLLAELRLLMDLPIEQASAETICRWIAYENLLAKRTRE